MPTAPMFAPSSLAAAVDRAEGRLCAGIAAAADAPDRAVVEIAGGVAVFAGLAAPTNKMIGVGFAGLPASDDLAAVESVFADRGAPLQAEVSTLAEPALHALLAGRGYEPRGFEHVLGCDLGGSTGTPAPHVAIQVVDEDRRDRWADVLVDGFAVPDTGGVGGDAPPDFGELRQWFVRTMAVPGFVCVLALVDGTPAGGAAIRIDGGIAQLCGAATLPAFRRRGVQTALLRWRLAHARAAGCGVAVVTTQPASKSQQNVQREGFALLYARQLLVKPPPADRVR